MTRVQQCYHLGWQSLTLEDDNSDDDNGHVDNYDDDNCINDDDNDELDDHFCNAACSLQRLPPQCHSPEGLHPPGPMPGVLEESRTRPTDCKSCFILSSATH